jgi:translation elongation factor EF-G
MPIVTVESVSSYEDMLVMLVNKLLQENATSQHMLVNQTPADERVIEKLSAMRARNTELEEINSHLRKTIDELREGTRDTTREPNYVDTFTHEIGHWGRDTFGDLVFSNKQERAARLIEEAIEVGQTLGVEPPMVHAIVDVIYAKPKGALAQALGGVIITWAGLLHALNLSATKIMADAQSDCWDRQEQIKKKHEEKIKAGISLARPKLPDPIKPVDPRAIDGDAAIKRGRENRDKFINSTRQSDRGE